MNRRAAAVEDLVARLGHEFADRALLEQALTHPGAGEGGRRIVHNQVLEFLGDRVLGLIAAETLVRLRPQWREGELSRRQVTLVSGPSCAKVARRLGIGPALRLAGAAQGGRENDRILGDAMEAVMAAVYLDGGLAAARSLFECAWRDALAEALGAQPADAKTALNEWAMARGLPAPAYETVARAGPPHAPEFSVTARVEGHAPAQARGPSLRLAQKAAAAAFLAREAAA